MVTSKLAASLKTVADDTGVTIMLRPSTAAGSVAPSGPSGRHVQAANVIDFKTNANAYGSFKAKGTGADLQAFKV